MDYAALEQTTLLVDAGSGLAFLALGAWVLGLAPRRPVTLALGGYAVALGLNVFVHNIGTGRLGWLAPPWEAVEVVATLAVSAALVALALLFPRPLARGKRAGPIATAGTVGAVQLIGVPLAAAAAATTFDAAVDAVYVFGYAATWFALALFALRYGRADSDEERHAVAIVTVALGLEIGLRTGLSVVANRAISSEPTIVGAAVLATAALVALWLRATTRGPPDARRRARNLALLFPALLLLGAVFAAATDPSRAFNLGPMGLSRIAGVLLLAWAILRGLLPGVDARVRWTISKSTVAAAFVAAFFVASEGAQLAFGQGNEWVGLLAAGALVFAIAPLQRAAERFAERAVPPTPAAPRDTDALAVYRRQARTAWRDGALGANERLMLRELRGALAIPAEDAERIDSEEAERAMRYLRP